MVFLNCCNVTFHFVVFFVACFSHLVNNFFSTLIKIFICRKTDSMYTPASSKPVSRTQTKSTNRLKTGFVTPSNQKHSTVQSNSLLQSKGKSTLKAVHWESVTSSTTDASKHTCEADSNNAKTYNDKTLDMRCV